MKAAVDLAASVRWNDECLAPAVVQDAGSGRVLMLAWMNAESLCLSVGARAARTAKKQTMIASTFTFTWLGGECQPHPSLSANGPMKEK